MFCIIKFMNKDVLYKKIVSYPWFCIIKFMNKDVLYKKQYRTPGSVS